MSASFECLKSTMSVYLTQEARPEKSAHWIVRNFEQIDGDILRSKLDAAGEKCYHFACLSDADLNTVKVPEFPWPLDEVFSKSHKILWTGNIKSMSTHAENKKISDGTRSCMDWSSTDVILN